MHPCFAPILTCMLCLPLPFPERHPLHAARLWSAFAGHWHVDHDAAWHQREALATKKTTTSVLSFTSFLQHLPCMPTAVLSWHEWPLCGACLTGFLASGALVSVRGIALTLAVEAVGREAC
jgi:hypothetical protein